MTSILFIDDDAMVGEAARILLTSRGHAVTVAHSGKSGLAELERAEFDVAIVDLFMPEMDGLTVIKAIRERDASLPIIAASGFLFAGSPPPTMPNFDSMAAEAGAVSTLYKPFKPDDLLRAIESAMDAGFVATPKFSSS